MNGYGSPIIESAGAGPRPVTKSSLMVTLPEGDGPATLRSVGGLMPEQPAIASTAAAKGGFDRWGGTANRSFCHVGGS